MSNGLQFNLSYTYSRSKDTSSADPGSTAGGGKPDVPNVGLRRAGQPARSRRELRAVGLRPSAPLQRQLRLRAARAVAARLPGLGLRAAAVRPAVLDLLGGAGDRQTRRSTATSCAGRADSIAPAFGRPSLCGSLDELRQAGDRSDGGGVQRERALLAARRAGGYPGNLGFGNLGRNVLRGFWQRRVDLSLATTFTSGRRADVEAPVGRLQRVQHGQLRAARERDRRAGTDFGKITNTVGGPRVMQFGAAVPFLSPRRRGPARRLRPEPG